MSLQFCSFSLCTHHSAFLSLPSLSHWLVHVSGTWGLWVSGFILRVPCLACTVWHWTRVFSGLLCPLRPQGIRQNSHVIFCKERKLDLKLKTVTQKITLGILRLVSLTKHSLIRSSKWLLKNLDACPAAVFSTSDCQRFVLTVSVSNIWFRVQALPDI